MQQLFSLTRFFIMLIMLSLFGSSSQAQHINATGYFIDTQGDTTKGNFPRYKQWNHNPDKIQFIPFQNSNPVVLTPSTCQEFHIDGYETYTAFHGKRMINPMEFYQPIPGNNSDRYDTITTFLREFAISDNYRFYIFKDINRFNLFYSTTKGVITELLHKIYVTDNNVIQSTTYKNQLQSLFPDKSEEINHLLYSEEDLAKFIGKQKTGIVNIKKKQNGNGGFYISGGVSINSFKFTPIESMNFTERDYKSSQVPLVSIGYIVPFSRNFSRAFFLPQIKITSINHTTQTSDKDAYPAYSTTFSSSPIVSLGFHFGYKIIHNPNLELSFAPGVSYYFLTKFKQVNNYKFSSTNSLTDVTEMEHLKPLVDLQATLIVRKRYVIWSAYNFSANTILTTDTKYKFTSKQLGVGYKFK